MTILRKLFGLVGVTVICWVVSPSCNSVAQDVFLQKVNALLLKNTVTNTDSVVIAGMLADLNSVLLSKFGIRKVDKFYASVGNPEDYFINMKKILGWNFGTCARRIQEFIVKKQGIDTIGDHWSIYETPNFMVYYMASTSETQVMQTLGAYLEEELGEMKSLLSISQNGVLRELFIRSFYPDSAESYKIPDRVEQTGGKMQILLFPNLSQFQHHFPYSGIDKETGGMCLFSLYQNPAESTRIFIDLKVAMVFGGYISFPFLTHELAHALHFVYYSDLDSLEQDAQVLNKIYQERGKAAYDSGFWPTFKDRIPGNNGIFEEAIANYAMFSTGPFLRSGIVPPLRYLIDRRIKPKSKLISKGAQGGVPFTLLDFIGSKLKLSRTPEQKIAEEIFSWADFLKFLNASHSPLQMRQLYSIKEQDLSNQFNAIFGQSIRKSELEWCKSVSN